MPVIQRIKHLAEDIEELVIARPICDLGSVGLVLLFPVDIPQVEKWVSFVEGLPQGFEVLFRVTYHHRFLNQSFCTATESHFKSKPALEAEQERSDQGARLGINFNMSSEKISWSA